ncbi:MAG: universal stress protein [Actinomycetes bacterium]
MEPTVARGGVVVVGVDGSPASARALAWAADEAATRAETLQVITAWSWMPNAPGAGSPHEAREHAEALAQAQVSEVLAGRAHPPVVSLEVVEDTAPAALATASRDASMIVVGSHGHSRLHHAVLGSVSLEVIRTAACPVVVIPAPSTAPEHGSDLSLEGIF